MGIIDFCVIVIFSFAIVRGFSAGLAKQIFAFANWFLALTLAALFAGPFARYLNGTVLYSLLEEKTAAYLAARSPVFAAALDRVDSGAQIGAALGELGLPGFIGDFIIRRAGVVAPSPEATLAQALAAPVAEAAPLSLWLPAMVGVPVVFQQTPCAVGLGTPRLVMLPLPVALFAVIALAAWVVTVGVVA